MRNNSGTIFICGCGGLCKDMIVVPRRIAAKYVNSVVGQYSCCWPQNETLVTKVQEVWASQGTVYRHK